MTESAAEGLARYEVEPLEPTSPVAPAPRRSDLSPGCGLFAVLAVVLYVSTLLLWDQLARSEHSSALIGDRFAKLHCGHLALFLLPSILITYGLFLWRRLVLRRADQRALDERSRLEWEGLKRVARDKAAAEARVASQAIRSLLVASADLRSGLFEALGRADAALTLAVGEYQARAFSPFWDAIERAAAALNEYDRGLAALVDAAGQYYSRLAKRRYSFPPFPYVSSDLPSEEDVVLRFREVVRMAQTDYQFANIWEQRKTRETIATGFGSLQAAVREMSSEIRGGFQDVQVALEGGFDRLVEAQGSSTRVLETAIGSTSEALDRQRRELSAILRTQDEKLDNIQWRRKPLGSKYLRT